MKTLLVLFASIIGGTGSAPSENHAFHIHGAVKYRCYAGYDGKKVTDARTGAVCDNKSYDKVVIDQTVMLALADEPDPEDVHELYGSWERTFDHKGHKFQVLLSVSKADPKLKSPTPYRVSLYAADDEPLSRHTTVYTEMAVPTALNPLTVDESSAGTKEEISFTVTVTNAVR